MSPVVAWIADNWIDVLQSIGIIAGLVFAAAEFRLRRADLRVSARFDLTRHHFDLWGLTFSHPDLERVLERRVDLRSDPITPREFRFVNSLILHLDTSLEAAKRGIYELPDGLEADIRDFFSRPIPRTVWEEGRQFRDSAFRAHVESILDRDKSRVNK